MKSLRYFLSLIALSIITSTTVYSDVVMNDGTTYTTHDFSSPRTTTVAGKLITLKQLKDSNGNEAGSFGFNAIDGRALYQFSLDLTNKLRFEGSVIKATDKDGNDLSSRPSTGRYIEIMDITITGKDASNTDSYKVTTRATQVSLMSESGGQTVESNTLDQFTIEIDGNQYNVTLSKADTNDTLEGIARREGEDKDVFTLKWDVLSSTVCITDSVTGELISESEACKD